MTATSPFCRSLLLSALLGLTTCAERNTPHGFEDAATRPDRLRGGDLLGESTASSAERLPQVVGLEIVPPSLVINPTHTAKFTAMAKWTDNTLTDVSGAAFWSSSDPEIVTVENGQAGGSVSAHMMGTAWVTAQFDGYADTGKATITGPPIP